MFLRESSKPGARIGVVMDNARAHVSGSAAWSEQFAPMNVPSYGPCYGPEPNPAEQVFRQLRARLSNRAFEFLDQTADAMLQEIRRFWEQLEELTRLTYYPWWRQAVEDIPP